MKIVLDIETVPAQDDRVIAIWEDNFKAPAQYKKPESIEKWKAENRDAELLKTALNPDYGQISSIAYRTKGGETKVKSSTELHVLGWFYNEIESLKDHRGYPVNDIEFICHNAAFDLPYIWKRMIVNDLFMPKVLERALTVRYPLCTMTKWAGYGKFIGLDRLCKILGIETKSAKGTDVFDWYANNEFSKIEEYNAKDVDITYQVAKRLGML